MKGLILLNFLASLLCSVVELIDWLKKINFHLFDILIQDNITSLQMLKSTLHRKFPYLLVGSFANQISFPRIMKKPTFVGHLEFYCKTSQRPLNIVTYLSYIFNWSFTIGIHVKTKRKLTACKLNYSRGKETT